jgi:adenylosuccinate synthase
MAVMAVVGANWGDEGKGKITDYLARNANFVVRFQGGSNAGHTILNTWGKFVLHTLPSGVFYPHIRNVIGPGVAVNINNLIRELQALQDRSVPTPQLFLSERAQIVLPTHIALDRYEEERLAENQFGSTRSGIAPFYADKAFKIGVQVADLFKRDLLRDRIERNLALKNILLVHGYRQPVIDPASVTETLWRQGSQISEYLADTTTMLRNGWQHNETIVLEGQLGALRDPDHGIYPFTTSSSPLAGFASVGAGIPPYAITRIIAVTKAYSTCVGAGPFVTELHGSDAETLRSLGGDSGEYGATTGRPRRVGWFDAVATRYGCALQGATEVALTNLDVLGYLAEIPIAVGYRLDGRVTNEFPITSRLMKAQPVFDTMPGWQSDIRSIREYHRLPSATRRYVERIEEVIGTPVNLISVGPDRDQILVKE